MDAGFIGARSKKGVGDGELVRWMRRVVPLCRSAGQSVSRSVCLSVSQNNFITPIQMDPYPYVYINHMQSELEMGVSVREREQGRLLTLEGAGREQHRHGSSAEGRVSCTSGVRNARREQARFLSI